MGKRTRKSQDWDVGDVFVVPQRDGLWTAGQVLDRMMPTVVSTAYYDLRVSRPEDLRLPLPPETLISVASVTKEALDRRDWPVVGRAPIGVERHLWPNEPFREKRWVGAKIYDAAIIEEFLEAFYGLVPWDDWKDPRYLDRLLISLDKKPANLVYKSS